MDRLEGVKGKTVLITGATSGIGREAARALARMGARVILGVRDSGRGRQVADQIGREGGEAEALAIDLASFSSTRDAAARLAASRRALDVLVNNAAIVTRRREVTADGHEVIWQTNFLGAFLLTRLLLPLLKAAPAPRIVNVSSQAHHSGRMVWDDLQLARGGFKPFRAYCNTKLALVLFTRELARREPAIAVNAVHPGVIATNIWRPAPAPIRFLLGLVLTLPVKGVRPLVRLASAPDVDGVTGRYFDRMSEKTPAPAAQGDADAARLWKVAEEATGLQA